MPRKSEPLQLWALISGGHSGVQRAALDAAIDLGFSHGGFCPKQRLCDDGVLAPRYQLKPTHNHNHYQLCSANVKGSDGTLIVSYYADRDQIDGMSRFTIGMCNQAGKPFHTILIGDEYTVDATLTIQWLRDHRIGILNVIGPRETRVQNARKSRAYRPGIAHHARQALHVMLAPHRDRIIANALAQHAAHKAESTQAPDSALLAPPVPARPRDDTEPHGPPLAPQP